MAIEYLSLDITCRFTVPAFLPAFKGSTLRGALGHSLKQVACALRNQECETCLLSGTCAYSYIFATEKLSGERIAARPHPYIINPPMGQKRDYLEGDSLTFNLVLLGRAIEYLPHIIYSVEEMGRRGIGRGNGSGAGQFCLKIIHADGQVIYDQEDKTLRRPSLLPSLKLEENTREEVDCLTIDLISPLRIKSDNSFQRKLTFPVLARAALRRISALEKYYGHSEPDLDYQGLRQLAESITISKSDIRWRDYSRYSSKQRRTMFFGGMVGKIQCDGELQPFVPLFEYASQVNLGKQTAFGLGRMKLECQ